jgi:hypothetical protein
MAIQGSATEGPVVKRAYITDQGGVLAGADTFECSVRPGAAEVQRAGLRKK